jgi:hypothetical protein
MQIDNCSPEMAKKIKSYDDAIGTFVNIHHRSQYPFDSLKIGQCFWMPLAEANEPSIRLSASNAGRKTGKKFSVMKHRDSGTIEVARIK